MRSQGRGNAGPHASRATKSIRQPKAEVWPDSRSRFAAELHRAERDILVAVRDVAEQFIGGPVVPRLPKQIGQRDGECGKEAAEPNPFPGKVAALRRQQKPR